MTTLSAGQCNNFDSPDAKISSYKIYHGGHQVARCSFYASNNCDGYPIVTTMDTTIYINGYESYSNGHFVEEASIKARSYNCDLYTTIVPPPGG